MADFTDKQLQQNFIKEELDQHGEFLFDILEESIREKKLIKSEELIDSISYKVTEDSRGPKLSVSFNTYGRFIEINYFKRRSNTREFLTPRPNSANFKKKRPKNTQWYARNVYGSINRLAGRLMSGYTNEEIERMKRCLSNLEMDKQKNLVR